MCLTGTVPRWHALEVTKLHTFMRVAGLTDQALAEQVGVSRPYIARIRSGKRQPSLDVAVRLSVATGLPAEAFIQHEAA